MEIRHKARKYDPNIGEVVESRPLMLYIKHRIMVKISMSFKGT